jgi:hypothetical protein
MIQIDGTIRTAHTHPTCVAEAIRADNLSRMQTTAEKGHVMTEIDGTKLRSIIASVDDYLMNLAIAEEVCCYASH